MANLGSLVVSLEANMAKFQTDMQKSAAITEQSMLKMALSSEQTKVAINRLETQFGNAGNAAISMGKNLLFGAAVGLSFDALGRKISGVIDAMANLKTMSEKTGASVENLSKLGFIAKQSGSDIEAISGAMSKLSKGMAGADNETKGAGLALSYLGVKAKDAAGNLKDPAEMFTEIAKKLNTYQDGAGKAAIAQALFGRAGAEMLPTLKLLGEQGDMVAKVTDAQATEARLYTRDLAKLEAQKNMLFKTVAIALLPTMRDFTDVLIDATKDTNVLNGAAKGLAADHSIEDWADAGAMVLAGLIDTIKVLPSLFSITSGAIVDIAARARIASLVFLGTNAEYIAAVRAQEKTQEELGNKVGAYMDKEVDATQTAMRAKIEARNKDRASLLAGGASAAAAAAAEKLLAEKAKPKLNYNTSGEDTSGRADDPAKKLLEGQLKAQEAFIAAEKTQLATREQYLQYYYQLEYTNASDFYGTKNQLIQDALKDQLAAYDKQSAAAAIYLAQANTLTKQQDARNIAAEISKKRAAAEIESSKRLTDSILDQAKAYREFDLATTQVAHQAALGNAQAQFQIDLIGRGTLEVAKLTEAKRIELALEQRLYEMRNKNLPEAEMQRAATEALMQKNAALELIEESYSKQRTAIFGASEAMRKYAENTGNQAAQIEGAMTSAFSKAEDAFVNFAKTGKLDFKSLADSIISDLIRIQARQAIAGAMGSSGGGGLLGMISGLFGGGGSSSVGGVGGLGSSDLVGSSLMFAAGGYDIPAGVNPLTQLHQKEMVLPAEHAETIRSLSGSGMRGNGGENITIINQTSGRIDSVTSQRIAPGERQLIIQEAKEAVASDLYDPNSRVSRSMRSNYNSARTR